MGVMVLGCCGCTAPISRGLFDSDFRMPDLENTYITVQSDTSVQLKRITENSLNYYEWKTVKYHRQEEVENEKKGKSTISFVSYKTISNDEINQLPEEESFHLIPYGEILKNYLFFLDDYRCIYLSQDDDRSLSYGKLYLTYGKNYTFGLSKKNDKRVLRQTLMGYYHIKDSTIFIDFNQNKNYRSISTGEGKHFYVKGIVNNKNQIELKEIFYPARKESFKHINTPYHPIDESLDASALPVFELPDTSDRFVDDQFELKLSPKLRKNRDSELHQQIRTLYKEKYREELTNEQLTQFKIISIEYGSDINKPTLREYTLEFTQKFATECKKREVKITELITIDTNTGKLSDSFITW